ncbi:hypothetical protein [Marixanthomonas spongiae]|uniref:Membrane metalloprotease n=1 Tax=Marixanthomonas spongiae TaxID=2174845 RepID=A0A2U0I5B8_9FLAO|nr:hypothetical protein [Marixanthomonas spongiae]PVW16303.1 hypothetical protein DDV96_03295 [Marixanthomonas spongiae]
MKISLPALFLFFFSTLVIGCKDDDSNTIDPTAENKKSLGKSAEDILSDDIYQSLTIEFVYAPGYPPTEETKIALEQFLDQRIKKPGGIIIKETVIDPPTGAPFDIDEIKEIEENNRTAYTKDDNLAVYVFLSNGKSNKDTDKTVTLGTAYRNTSIVVYKKTLLDLINNNQGGGDLATLETTTLEHEFGHILGLVNITNDDIHPKGHEDADNSRHCVIDNCLMYFQASNTGRKEVARFLQRRATVPQLDSLCIEDLQAKGGK